MTTAVPRGTSGGWPSSVDSALVDWIAEDRVDQRWSRERAERLVDSYRRWLQGIHRPVSDEDEGRAALWLDSTFFRPGRAATVYAPVGRGKTHLCSWMCQQIARFRPGWDIYTNVPFAWDRVPGVPRPETIHRVVTMTQTLRGIANSMLANRRSALVIDEFDQADNSHQWQSEASRSWAKFMFIERHLRVRGPLLVHHDFDWIPRPLRKGDLGTLFRTFYIGGEYRVANREDLDHWWVTADQCLPFGTLALESYSIDLDVAELASGLSGGHLDVAHQIIRYLDQLEEERAEEAAVNPIEARSAHRASVAARQRAQAEADVAWLERREEGIAMLARGESRWAVQERLGTSARYVAELAATAAARSRAAAHEQAEAGGPNVTLLERARERGAARARAGRPAVGGSAA